VSLYAHFRPEEKPLVERIIELTELVSERKQLKLTSFLDPREQFIVQSIVGRSSDVMVSFYGGYTGAERQRALIIPEYMEVSPGDFQVALLSIEGNYGTSAFEHRDVLGSLLGLGVKREKFGDILISEQAQQCLIAQEIVSFVETHLQQIGRHSVSSRQIGLEQLSPATDEWSFRDRSVSSLRLDVILSEILSISRSKATPLIKSGKVKVNWKLVEQVSMILEEGDILSVKGHGRFLFSDIEGITKKQKVRVRLGQKKA
jgi:RNA-binding protein YlmH